MLKLNRVFVVAMSMAAMGVSLAQARAGRLTICCGWRPVVDGELRFEDAWHVPY